MLKPTSIRNYPNFIDQTNTTSLECGTVDGVYATVDFGTGPSTPSSKEGFGAQRKFAPKGPLVKLLLLAKLNYFFTFTFKS